MYLRYLTVAAVSAVVVIAGVVLRDSATPIRVVSGAELSEVWGGQACDSRLEISHCKIDSCAALDQSSCGGANCNLCDGTGENYLAYPSQPHNVHVDSHDNEPDGCGQVGEGSCTWANDACSCEFSLTGIKCIQTVYFYNSDCIPAE